MDRYVRNCYPCHYVKASRQSPFGMRKLNIVPDAPWQDISLEFVVGLPESKEYDSNWMVVDCLTKLRHMVPSKSTYSTEDRADLFLHNVWKHHGLPDHIISDHGLQFSSRLWKVLCQRLNIEQRLCTGFHLQTDG